jgi:hypothetical protein
MLKASVKIVERDPEIYQVVIVDHAPVRGKTFNIQFLLSKKGLETLFRAGQPVLEGHTPDNTVQEV